MKSVKKILFIFFSWRIFLSIPVFLGQLLIPYRPAFDYTRIWPYIAKTGQFFINPFLYIWSNFDGIHYLNIAGNGYTDNGRFFPLYPLLIRIFSMFSPAFTPLQFISAFILSNLIFISALFVFYKLVRLDYSDNYAIKSIVLLLIFPAVFFFGAIYSEGLFLLTTLLALYFARQKNWFLASVFTASATATRFVGIALIPAVLYEFISHEKSYAKKIWPLILMPLGLIMYTLYSHIKWSDPFFYIHAQGLLSNGRAVNGLVFPLQTMYRYFKIFISLPLNIYEYWIALLEFILFIFGSTMLLIAWKQKIRASYLIFSLGCFLMPIFSGTFSGLPRYIAVMFPIFISLALVKKPIVKIAYVIISIIALTLLLMFFSRGYYVA